VALRPYASPASFAFNVSTPGLYHLCVSTRNGEQGSWWPQGELRDSVFAHIIPQATAASITSVSPLRAPEGRIVSLDLTGAPFSAFSKIALAESGNCSTNRLTSDVVIGERWTNVTVPPPGEYVLCYYQENLSGWLEQTSIGVGFESFATAVATSVTSMQIRNRISDPRGNGAVIVVPANIAVDIKFIGASSSPFTQVAFTQGSSCSDSSVLVGVTNLATSSSMDDLQADFAAVKIAKTTRTVATYAVCYSAQGASADPMWVLQSDLSVIVTPPATPASVLSAACGSSQTDICMPDGSARASRPFDLTVSLPIPSPFARIAFAPPGVGCTTPSGFAFQTSFSAYTSATTSRVSITLNNITFNTPGSYTICFSAAYTSTQETGYASQRTFISVSEVFEQAQGLAPDGNMTNAPSASAAGGTLVTIKGTGFQASAQYACQLRRGDISSQETVATVIDATTMACDTPAWPGSAGHVFLAVLIRRMPGSTATVMWKVGEGSGNNGHPIMIVPEWKSITPMVGDKLGGDTVTLFGHGFIVDPATQNAQGTYPAKRMYCNFSRSDGLVVSSVNAVVISPGIVTCVTPLWSRAPWNMYDAESHGTTQLSLVAEWGQGHSTIVKGLQDAEAEFVFQ
jgi:hypothetical protein